MSPNDFTILFAPLLFVPAAVALWLLSWVLRRPSLFAWASIIQSAVVTACVFYFVFGTLPHNHTGGIVAGLLGGLAIAFGGRTLYQKSLKSK